MSEEEYQVDYDPEILADLQKLKGSNWLILSLNHHLCLYFM